MIQNMIMQTFHLMTYYAKTIDSVTHSHAPLREPTVHYNVMSWITTNV